MKLYYCPGACSLAAHIALIEYSVPFIPERVDVFTGLMASGGAYSAVNPKGYVPALELDNGQVLTENAAILDYIATLIPEVGLDGPMGRWRLLESLVFVSTELHSNFRPFYRGGGEAEKATAGTYLARRLDYLAGQLKGQYWHGDWPTIADYYLFVLLFWAQGLNLPVPAPLAALYERFKARPATRAAFIVEGLA